MYILNRVNDFTVTVQGPRVLYFVKVLLYVCVGQNMSMLQCWKTLVYYTIL